MLYGTAYAADGYPKKNERIYIALGSSDTFHPFVSDRDDTYLSVGREDAWSVASLTTLRQPQWSETELRGALEVATRRSGCRLGAIRYLVEGESLDHELDWMDDDDARAMREFRRSLPHDIEVDVHVDRPCPMQTLIDADRDVQAMLQVLAGGIPDVDAVRNLVRGGRLHLLRGLSECDWLEVKSRAYPLSEAANISVKAKIELAQDVARFANGVVDAALIVGISELSGNPGTLGDVSAIPLTLLDPVQHMNVLDARIVPPVEGLQVEKIDLGDGSGVLMISVPRQPRELQPFLVHGAVIGEKVEGSFISIVRRRGEGSITTSAEQIHAYIVAGRAFLRSTR